VGQIKYAQHVKEKGKSQGYEDIHGSQYHYIDGGLNEQFHNGTFE
jgi:hypothetical protein